LAILPRRISSTATIGRAEELRLLADALDAARSGVPGLVLLSGEAGIGKTRLVAEIEAQACAQEFMVLHGECIEFGGEDLAYAPIVGALRALPAAALAAAVAGLPVEAREQLTPFLPFPLDDARRDVAPARLSGDLAQAQIFELLLGVLRRLAHAVAPILLVFEDLHWGDSSSRSFVAFLLRNVDQDRLILVVTYRADGSQHDERMQQLVAELARHPRTMRIELRSLSAGQVTDQIEQIAGSAIGRDVVEEISGRAGGNPFFVEELVQSRLDGRDDQVSATVADIARSRVRALDAPARRLLELVCAAGGHLSLSALARIVAENDLSMAIRAAVDAHLLVCDGSGDRVSYRHGLIGEAIYGDLLPIERLRLHRTIASALVDEPGTAAAQLAYHWYRAGEHAKAFATSLRAGLDAERLYAFAEARTHFERTLQLWDAQAPNVDNGDVDQAGLLTHLAEAARFTGDYGTAISCSRDALSHVDAELEPLRAAMLHERIGEYSFDDDEAALQSYRVALSLLPDDAHEQRAWIFAAEGRALLRMRCWEDARARSREALRIAGEVDSDRVTTAALSTLGMALTMLGDAAAGEDRLMRALEMARSQRSAEDIGHAWTHLAESYRLQGRHGDALKAMIEADAEARQWGVQRSFGRFLRVNAVDDLLRLGRWDEAQRELDACAKLDLGSTGRLLFEALYAHLQLLRGDLPAARRALQAAADLLRRAGFVDFVPVVQGGWAMLDLAEGQPLAARDRVAAALSTMAYADAEEAFYTPLLHVVGMQAEAELAVDARARRAGDELVAIQERARAIRDSLDHLLLEGVDRSNPPDAGANRALVQAEFMRVLGEPDAGAWAATTRRWQELAEPYPVAYAKFRHAEATLVTGGSRALAAELLTDARAIAASLGAAPLLGDVEALARRARLVVGGEST
jgi:tetratricopeptide (TPR) repeat protein